MFHSGTRAAIRRFISSETGGTPNEFGMVAVGLGAFILSAIWFLGGEFWRTVCAKIIAPL
jgi:hypothetical protein